jgi:hypothetical protein
VAGAGLEANLGVADDGRAQAAQLALEHRVAAAVPVLAAQLGVEVGPADAGADGQPALDVDQLGLVQCGRLRTGTVAARPLARELTLDGAPVEAELLGQGGDGPAVGTQDFQRHRHFLRLHARSPAGA